MSKTKQASGRMCFVCGVENPVGLHLKFYATRPQEVTVDFTAPDHYQSYPGVLHGGIVASILDETAGRALMGDYPPRFMFTAKLEVKYRKNVPVGMPLKVVGKAVKERDRTAEGWSGSLMLDNEKEQLVGAASCRDLIVAGSHSPKEQSSLSIKLRRSS